MYLVEVAILPLAYFFKEYVDKQTPSSQCTL